MTSHSKPIRLLYITYNENVLDSGILRSQVRDMLVGMRKLPGVEYVRLLSFISPRLWLRRRRGYRRLVGELKERGIDFRFRLMPAAQAWRWGGIPLFIAFNLPVLLSHLIRGRINIIHARSYAAGLLALCGSKLTCIRFVFDPRGMFPEEMVLNNVWREGGQTFRIWKALEKKIIRDCQAVVALTPRLKRYYLERGAVKAIFAPSRLNVEPFNAAARKVADYQKNMLFIGEMDAVWNSPQRVAMHYKRLRMIIPELKLKLITRKDHRIIEQILDKEGLERGCWTLEASQPEEMPDRMAGSGIGLAMAFQPVGRTFLSAYSSADGQNPSGNWPMKYAEYLAAGVPVAVEREIGEHITRAVERWKLGVVLDENDPNSYSGVVEVIRNRSEYTGRCTRYARMKLSISHTATQYARLYRQLLKS